MCHK